MSIIKELLFLLVCYIFDRRRSVKVKKLRAEKRSEVKERLESGKISEEEYLSSIENLEESWRKASLYLSIIVFVGSLILFYILTN